MRRETHNFKGSTVTFDNFIGVFENAFTDQWCDNLIEFFETRIEKAVPRKSNVYPNDTNEYITKGDISIKDVHIEVAHYDMNICNNFFNIMMPFYDLYSKKYYIYHPLRPLNVKIQKTEVSEGYHGWHAEDEAPEVSDRYLAWTLYLNDVKEGGETEFLQQSIRIKPKKGALCIFPASFTHKHRGNPPLVGTKYIATGWFHYVDIS